MDKLLKKRSTKKNHPHFFNNIPLTRTPPAAPAGVKSKGKKKKKNMRPPHTNFLKSAIAPKNRQKSPLNRLVKTLFCVSWNTKNKIPSMIFYQKFQNVETYNTKSKIFWMQYIFIFHQDSKIIRIKTSH